LRHSRRSDDPGAEGTPVQNSDEAKECTGGHRKSTRRLPGPTPREARFASSLGIDLVKGSADLAQQSRRRSDLRQLSEGRHRQLEVSQIERAVLTGPEVLLEALKFRRRELAVQIGTELVTALAAVHGHRSLVVCPASKPYNCDRDPLGQG
jgi:hypothetical protein